MQVSVENCCLLYRGKPQKENGGEYISVVLALVVFFVCAVSAYAISFLIWTRHAKAVFWINHLQLLLAKALLLTEPES